MSVEIREASAADRSDVTALALGRCPDTEPWMIDLLFTDSLAFDAFVVAVDGDEVVGFGYSGNIPGTPAPQRSTYVAVAATHEDSGLGSRIYRHCRAAQDESVTDLRARVFDDDPRSLAIAKHWGFEVSQRSITSRAELVGVAAPVPPDGVTLDAADDLAFPDDDAVEAMFAASQTNPEARNNHLMTLAEIRKYVFPGERGIVCLARVDGVPAALCFAIAGDGGDDGSVAYTGVDPAFRGRGLGRLVKQHVHHRAHESGVVRLSTDNEEHNEGIRRLNDEMGFTTAYGVYRMRQLL